jgi:hypothetical protein
MGIEKLIAICALFAMLAVSTGQLPRILCAVQTAQIHLLQDSQASKWGQGMLLNKAYSSGATHSK